MKVKSFVVMLAGALLLGSAGCASTKPLAQTESMLSEAGFKTVAASSEKQVKQLQALPVDKLSVVKWKGKTLYVFPDPAHNRIYLGGSEEYQSYQEILENHQIAVQSRVMADLGEDTGDDTVEWSGWSNNTGWSYGSF